MVSFADIAGFVCDQTSVRADRLTPQTRLVHDLGIDGDDLVDLMDAFFAGFNVDPAGFEARRHAGPEGLDLLGVLNPFGRKDDGPVPITLAMLLAAAQTGRWGDEA